MSERPALADALSAEITGFEALNRVLEEEYAALVGADVDHLLSLSDDKARAVEHLAELAQARSAALHATSLDPRADTFRAQIAAHDSRLPSLWTRLVCVATQARERNRSNGELLASRMAHNRAALDTFHAAARHHSIYGPDGQSLFQSANRVLGQA